MKKILLSRHVGSGKLKNYAAKIIGGEKILIYFFNFRMNITSATYVSEIVMRLGEGGAETAGELVETKISDFGIYCVTLNSPQIPFPRHADPMDFAGCRIGKYH